MKDSEKLLEIVQGHAPDRETRARMAELHDIAVADGMNEEELTVLWARVLLDGINYGNWPWVLRSQLHR